MILRDAGLLLCISLFYWAGAYLVWRHVENALIRYSLFSYPIYIAAMIAGFMIGSTLGAR